MNTNRSHGRTLLIPLAESAAVRTRDSADGSSPSTSATRIPIHTAAGPSAPHAPAATRQSIAEK